MAERLEQTAFYREWNFGRATQARNSQKTDLPQDSLWEDASNLAPVLNRLLNKPQVKQDMLERMRDSHPTVTDIQAPLRDNTVQVSLHNLCITYRPARVGGDPGGAQRRPSRK